MGEFNSDDHYIYYGGQELPRQNGVAHIVNKRDQNAVSSVQLLSRVRLKMQYLDAISKRTE